MTRVYWTIGFALVAIATGATVWLYGSLPEQIPTHWNIRGEVDGYGGKWSLFMFPVMMAGMLAGLERYAPAGGLGICRGRRDWIRNDRRGSSDHLSDRRAPLVGVRSDRLFILTLQIAGAAWSVVRIQPAR
jgi:hypothetical protein